MAKTSTPFLSFKASGSVGKSITAQRRGRNTLIRVKPFPTYRQTLPQLYQRWLYKDYAYLWQKQSDATKAQYRSAGVKYHLTAFQYWMKECLKDLPYFGSLYHLDQITSNITYDASRNANHGTVYGASLTEGRISKALHFDGINNYVNLGAPATLMPTSALTLEAWIKPATLAGFHRIIDKLTTGDKGWSFLQYTGLGLQLYASGSLVEYFVPNVLTVADIWYHVAATYDGAFVRLYLNGNLVGTPQAKTGLIEYSAGNISIGVYKVGDIQWFSGDIDETSINFNLALDATMLLDHSQRRYPV